MSRNIIWGYLVALSVGCGHNAAPPGLPTGPSHTPQVSFLSRYPSPQTMALTLALVEGSSADAVKLEVRLVNRDRAYSDIVVRGSVTIRQGGAVLDVPAQLRVGSLITLRPSVTSGSWDIEWTDSTLIEGTAPSVPCPPLCAAQRLTVAPLLVGGSVLVY